MVVLKTKKGEMMMENGDRWLQLVEIVVVESSLLYLTAFLLL